MGVIRYRLSSWVRGRWPALAAVSALTAALVAGSLLLLAGAVRTLSAPDRYTATQEDSFDLTLEQASGPPRGADVAALPAVRAVEVATFVFGGLLGDGDGPLDVLVFAGELGPTRSRVVEGRAPREANEFVASRSFLDLNGLRLGDEIQLITLTADQARSAGFDVEAPEGPQLTARVVGALGGPGDLEGSIALFPATLLDEGDIGISATIMAVGLSPGATIEDLRGQLDGLDEGGGFSIGPAEWVSSDIRAAVNAQGQGTLVVAVVISLAALVVLGQLWSRQLRPRTDEVSALAALGFSRRQSVAEPTIRAALAVVPAIVLAIVVAYSGSSLFPRGFVVGVEPEPGLRFDPAVLLGGGAVILVAIVTWVASASALDLRPKPPTTDLAFGERTASRIADPRLSSAVRFAFGSTDARLRPRGGLFGMVVVVAGVFAALTFWSSLDRLLAEPDRYGVNFDVGVGAGASAVSDEIVEALRSNRDVDAFTLYGTTTLSIGTRSIDIVGMRAVSGDLVPPIIRGRLPLVDDEIALGPKVAAALDLAPGDTIRASAVAGARTLRVTGIVVAPPVNGADVLGDVSLVTDEGLEALDPEVGLSFVGIDLAPGTGTAAIGRLADVTQSAVGPLDPPLAIVNLGRVRAMPLFVAVAMAGLALLSLAHVLIVSVRRRRVDHAMLRALGATPRWIGTVIMLQATVTTVVVGTFAVPVGVAVGQIAYRQLATAVGLVDSAQVRALLFVAVAIPAVVLANVVAAVPARRSRQSRPAELLRAVS